MLFGIIGAIFGSFFNVVIYRLPRENMSVNTPKRSICPVCKHKLSWKDNIPVISYLILKGKCRYCEQRISPRYPVVETLTALAFVLNSFYFPLYQSLALCLVASGLIIVSFIDIELMIIPDTGLIITGIGAATFSYLRNDWPGILVQAVIIFGLMIVFYLFANYFKKDSFGFGDVELLAILGISLGFIGILFTIMLSSVIALLAFILIKVIKSEKIKLDYRIPFGPFIALAGYIIIFFLDGIRNLYGL
ncbi:MAG: prepilin peptidase [Thermotogota bacterium]|nr:prepilin peptidase [Thermotogota bacterium]